MKAVGLLALLAGCQAVHSFAENSLEYQSSIEVLHTFPVSGGEYDVFVDRNGDCVVDFVLDQGEDPFYSRHPNMETTMRLMREYCPE